MAEDSGSGQDSGEVNTSPTPREKEVDSTVTTKETLVWPSAPPDFGWCRNCVVGGYHLSSDNGDCLDCACTDFSPREDNDELDVLDDLYHTPVDIDIYDDTVSVILSKSEEATITIYMGRVSRYCQECYETKLYKEFASPSDPECLCRSCEDEYERGLLLDMLTDEELLELEAIEEDIEEAEYMYEEISERQRLIDEVLRGLDE